MCRVGLYDGKLVLDEQFYENNLTYVSQGDEISINSRLLECNVTNQLIVADSASKTGIKELRIAGRNIVPVQKYAGSVKDGIELVQNYMPILITERSLNAKKELDNYTWIKDIRNDVYTKDPIDDYNHLLDLLRYVIQKKQHRGKGMRRVN